MWTARTKQRDQTRFVFSPSIANVCSLELSGSTAIPVERYRPLNPASSPETTSKMSAKRTKSGRMRMEYRNLGSSGIRVSVLSLGGWVSIAAR